MAIEVPPVAIPLLRLFHIIHHHLLVQPLLLLKLHLLHLLLLLLHLLLLHLLLLVRNKRRWHLLRLHLHMLRRTMEALHVLTILATFASISFRPAFALSFRIIWLRSTSSSSTVLFSRQPTTCTRTQKCCPLERAATAAASTMCSHIQSHSRKRKLFHARRRMMITK